MGEDIGGRLQQLEERLKKLEQGGGRPSREIDRAIKSKIQRVADRANVPVANVEKVFEQLGFAGLQRNLTDVSAEPIDEGRLVLSLISHRKLIFA